MLKLNYGCTLEGQGLVYNMTLIVIKIDRWQYYCSASINSIKTSSHIKTGLVLGFNAFLKSHHFAQTAIAHSPFSN